MAGGATLGSDFLGHFRISHLAEKNYRCARPEVSFGAVQSSMRSKTHSATPVFIRFHQFLSGFRQDALLSKALRLFRK